MELGRCKPSPLKVVWGKLQPSYTIYWAVEPDEFLPHLNGEECNSSFSSISSWISFKRSLLAFSNSELPVSRHSMNARVSWMRRLRRALADNCFRVLSIAIAQAQISFRINALHKKHQTVKQYKPAGRFSRSREVLINTRLGLKCCQGRFSLLITWSS